MRVSLINDLAGPAPENASRYEDPLQRPLVEDEVDLPGEIIRRIGQDEKERGQKKIDGEKSLFHDHSASPANIKQEHIH